MINSQDKNFGKTGSCKSQKNLELRVKGFINRQQVRPNDDFAFNKSAEILLEETTLDYSVESIKNSRSNLKDIQKFQEILKKQLDNKPSYMNSMILRKVNEKYEEILNLFNSIEARKVKLLELEKSLIDKMKTLIDKEKILDKKYKNICALQENKNNYDKSHLVTKKDYSDEVLGAECYYEKAQTPVFASKNRFESEIDSKLSQKSSELSKIAEQLKKKEQILINHSNDLKIKEKSLKVTEEFLKAQKVDLVSTIKHQLCPNPLNEIKSLSQTALYIENTHLLKPYPQNLYKTTHKNLLKEEARIMKLIKLSCDNKYDEILAEKLNYIEKKEAKLRSKQIELFELKEQLNDREEDLIQRECNFKYPSRSLSNFKVLSEQYDQLKINLSELDAILHNFDEDFEGFLIDKTISSCLDKIPLPEAYKSLHRSLAKKAKAVQESLESILKALWDV